MKKDKIIDPTSHYNLSRNTLVLKEAALKYYDQLEKMVNELAEKSSGGEEARLVFNSGSVTIKLK